MAQTNRKRRKTANKAKQSTTAQGPGGKSVALGVAAGLGAIAAIALGFVGLTRRGAGAQGAGDSAGRNPGSTGKGGNAEHPVPDLAADAPPVGSHRAPDAFRPDPTAPVPESERDGLRPATGPVPSLAAMRGESANQTGASNG